MTLERADVLRRIDATRSPTSPIVLTLGGTIREMLAVAGRKPNHLYSLDAMGQTSRSVWDWRSAWRRQRRDRVVASRATAPC